MLFRSPAIIQAIIQRAKDETQKAIDSAGAMDDAGAEAPAADANAKY